VTRHLERPRESAARDVSAAATIEPNVYFVDVPTIEKGQKAGRGKKLISVAELVGGVTAGVVEAGAVGLLESCPAKTAGFRRAGRGSGKETFNDRRGGPSPEENNRKYHIDRSYRQKREEECEGTERGEQGAVTGQTEK
jgi:hypothetical protein